MLFIELRFQFVTTNTFEKTDRNIVKRLDKHRKKPDHPMYLQLKNCVQFAEYLKFYELPDKDAVNTIVTQELHLCNAVIENTEIIDHNYNWAYLQYLARSLLY